VRFSAAFFKQRISDLLTAANPGERDAQQDLRRPVKLRFLGNRQKTAGLGGESQPRGASSLEILNRKLDSVFQRLDMFAVELTRRQNINEAITHSAIARMDSLLRHLRSVEGAEAGAAAEAHKLRQELVPEMIVVAEVEGHALGVPGRNWKLAWHYLLRGGLEPGVDSFIRQHLRPGMVFVDIGAGVGAYTLLAAVLTAGSGSIYSFEPDPEAFSILVCNLEVNGFGEAQGIRCRRTLTSADVFLTIGPVDLVRIGAEGVSSGVLQDLRAVGDRYPNLRIIVEYCAGVTGTAVRSASILEEIRAMGFSVRAIDGVTGEVMPVRPEEFASAFSVNLSLSLNPEA
jgi:hypothetical protein